MGELSNTGNRHRRSSTLERFDPLVSKERVEQGDLNKNDAKSASISSSGTATPVEECRDSVSLSPCDLAKELRQIAADLQKESPCPSPGLARRMGSNKSKSNQLPPSSATTVPNSSKRTWQRKLGRHRKSQSLISNSTPLNDLCKDVEYDCSNRASCLPPTPQTWSRQTTPISSPMIMDLWILQKEQQKETDLSRQESLFVPNLAKPRPTSFLTGNEAFRSSSEQDATDWQVEIPDKNEFEVCTRLCHFLDTYCADGDLLDLKLLVDQIQLTQFAHGYSSSISGSIADRYRSTVKSLLKCGDDIVEVKGYFKITAADDDTNDSRREVLILERQRQFLCVFRVTCTEQNQGKSNRNAETLTLNDSGGVKIFADRYMAYKGMENNVFTLLDVLTEKSLFCDVVFTGHSFGGASATLAAYRYALGRPELRVASLVTASQKVGFDDFRAAIHSSPNLKVFRLEYGNNGFRPQGGNSVGKHVGHTIRIHPSVGTSRNPTGQPVVAYRFGDSQEVVTPVRLLFNNKREKDVSDYVAALKDLDRFKTKQSSSWVKDYYNFDGVGVRGRDNEARQMV